MKIHLAGFFATLLTVITHAVAAPMLSLVSDTTGQSADSIIAGTSAYLIDLKANTDSMSVSGLQFYVVSTPAAAVTYGTVPVTALNTPFTAADLSGPTGGAIVQKTGGQIALFKSSAGDYTAFPTQSVAAISLNTSSLGAGTYVFTPIAQEFVNSTIDLPGSSFAPPQSFTLIITPTPEPTALVFIGITVCAVMSRRSAKTFRSTEQASGRL